MVEYFVCLGRHGRCERLLLAEPGFSPQDGLVWAILGWIAFAYLFFQMLFLLVSATQIRALGVLDSIIAIFPVVAGLVALVEWSFGHLPLSAFQLNALAMLLEKTRLEAQIKSVAPFF